jgi:hypothetical protein
MATDIHRRIIKGIKALGEGVTVKVVRTRKHVILEIARPGVDARHIPTATSPKDNDYAVINAINQARKVLGIPKK